MLLSVATTAIALATMATPSASADTAATAPAPQKSRLVCQVQEETGSRLRRKKVCLTQDEWMALKRETRMATDKMQTQRASIYPAE